MNILHYAIHYNIVILSHLLNVLYQRIFSVEPHARQNYALEIFNTNTQYKKFSTIKKKKNT